MRGLLEPGLPEPGLPEPDLPEVERILFADPIWAAYAIADLQPAMAGHCRWLTAHGAEGDALALIYRGLQPPILLTVGAPAVLAELLDGSRAELPPAIYASIRNEHQPAVSRYYDLSADTRPMWRMVLADAQVAEHAASSAHRSGLTAVRLAGAQTEDVLRLLAHGGPFSPDAFSPAQIDQGVFFGIYEGADLLAVGGTHIVDRTAAIAAIGNMYTHPHARRRGHSAAILRAIVGDLLRQKIDTIVLNVDQRNRGAQALYRAHGFVMHTAYTEGKGVRHA
jgi:ribosomal protein S18 acetylase RimI-like enzyme